MLMEAARYMLKASNKEISPFTPRLVGLPHYIS
jgi:hypothetical protein